MDKYKMVSLPQIQTIRNSGFAGMALHQVKKNKKDAFSSPTSTSIMGKKFAPKSEPKVVKRKFIPVNHYITNHHINVNVTNNFTII